MILDKLDKLTGREKLFLAVASICLFLVLTDRLVLEGVTETFRRLQRRMEEKENALVYRRKALARMEYVHARFREIEAGIEESSSDAEAIDSMSAEVDDLTRVSGLRLESIVPRDPKDVSCCREYAIDVGKFTGSIDQLLKFLHAVRARRGMMGIERLAVNPADKQGSLLQGSMLITKLMRTPDASGKTGSEQGYGQ